MNNLFNLKGKNVLVFGGAGLLGQEFTKSLVDHNANVISCDIVSLEIDKTIEDVEYYTFDASDEKTLLEFRDSIIEKYKHIDVIINSVTSKYYDFYLPFGETSTKGWEVGLRGNLTLPYMISKAFINHFCDKKAGSIINISSIYGMVGNDQSMYEGSNLHEIYVKDSPDLKQIYSNGVYNASKAGLINFTRYLAAYYGKYNVRVNVISPGGILYPEENKVFLKKYSDRTPMGRKANKDEINGAVIFLASDASSYVTGHNLVVDGGFTIW